MRRSNWEGDARCGRFPGTCPLLTRRRKCGGGRERAIGFHAALGIYRIGGGGGSKIGHSGSMAWVTTSTIPHAITEQPRLPGHPRGWVPWWTLNRCPIDTWV